MGTPGGSPIGIHKILISQIGQTIAIGSHSPVELKYLCSASDLLRFILQRIYLLQRVVSLIPFIPTFIGTWAVETMNNTILFRTTASAHSDICLITLNLLVDH